MIYRRENPNTPAKRFRSVILNPIGTKLSRKNFAIFYQKTVGKHFGKQTCGRRKKSVYKSKFNLFYGVHERNCSVLTQISLARRYKTFVGLLKYSNGAMSALPLFSGAYINQVLKVWPHSKNPKIHYFAGLETGSTVMLKYLNITSCFFNVRDYHHLAAFFCRAGGTFCIMVRFNAERGVCTVKLPSTKFINVHETSYVMLGRNSNILIRGIWLGKAGYNIRRGYRPAVRGVAMNPVDHPHGGRTKSNSPERTPWGKVAKFNK